MNVIEFWQTLSADAQFMDRKEVGSLSSPPLRASVWQCDPPAHLHSCAGPQRVLPSCEVQISILPLNLPLLISLFIPWLNISLVFSKTLWVLGGLNLENSAPLLCSSAKVKCCVLVWILLVGCNTHNFLLSLKLQVQMLTGGIYSDLYCWPLPVDIQMICVISAKQHHLSWQTSTASYYIRYERSSKDGSTWHIQTQKHRHNT